MDKKKVLYISVATIFLLLLIWTLWSNKALEVNTYCIDSEDIPAAFR